MNSRVLTKVALIITLHLLPTQSVPEVLSQDTMTTEFRVVVPYRDFFPECQENFDPKFCEWDFLVISRPPLETSSGILTHGEIQLTLPTFKWNGYISRIESYNYPNCTTATASNLLHDVSQQRLRGQDSWIARLPSTSSGCFSNKIVRANVGTDVYWVIQRDIVVASIDCKPPGAVINPNCGIEVYLKNGSVAISGGYFPYTNIEKFIQNFNTIMLDLSGHIPNSSYRYEMKRVFHTPFPVSRDAERSAKKRRREITKEF